MKTLSFTFILPMLCLIAQPTFARNTAPPAGSATTAAAAAAAVEAKPSTATPADTLVVLEDDNTRIEETRRRGEVVRLQVQSKVGGAAPYEITVRPGRGPASQTDGGAGRSAWRLFSF